MLPIKRVVESQPSIVVPSLKIHTPIAMIVAVADTDIQQKLCKKGTLSHEYRRLHQAADLAAIVSQGCLIRRQRSRTGGCAGRLRRYNHPGNHHARDDTSCPARGYD